MSASPSPKSIAAVEIQLVIVLLLACGLYRTVSVRQHPSPCPHYADGPRVRVPERCLEDFDDRALARKAYR